MSAWESPTSSSHDGPVVDRVDWLEFLRLRQGVDDLRARRKPPRKTRIACPPVETAAWSEQDQVEVGDIFTATLTALSRSRHALQGLGAVALANDPIPFAFTGELAGTSTDGQQIWVVVKPQTRKATDG